MRLLTQIGLPAFAGLLAAGCGGSPTAPSATAAATGTFTAPYPAPVSQTATGTWYVGERRFMTLTERESSVTGMPAPFTFDAGNGVTVSESGIINGVVEGLNVTLAITEIVTLSDHRPGVVCTVAHTFRGTLSGNTLAGTMIARTTPLDCGPGTEPPDVELSAVSGSTIFTRQ